VRRIEYGEARALRVDVRPACDQDAVALRRLRHRHLHIQYPRPAACQIEEHRPRQGRAVQGIGAVLGIDVGRAQAVHHQQDSTIGHCPLACLDIDGTVCTR